MKTIALAGFLLGSSILSATTACLNTPVASPDSQSICTTALGLGADLIAQKDINFTLFWNDNPGNVAPDSPLGADFDFNDAIGKGYMEAWGPGFVKIVLTYVSSNSAQTNMMMLGPNLLSVGQTSSLVLAAGSVVPFFDSDTSIGKTYHTGLDGGYGASQDLIRTTAPEPATCALIALPLLLIGFAKRRRKV